MPGTITFRQVTEAEGIELAPAPTPEPVLRMGSAKDLGLHLHTYVLNQPERKDGTGRSTGWHTDFYGRPIYHLRCTGCGHRRYANRTEAAALARRGQVTL
jgi:hypothetical protein